MHEALVSTTPGKTTYKGLPSKNILIEAHERGVERMHGLIVLTAFGIVGWICQDSLAWT